jgi:hypothetical protein
VKPFEISITISITTIPPIIFTATGKSEFTNVKILKYEIDFGKLLLDRVHPLK